MARSATLSNAARRRRKEKRPKKGGKAGCQGNFHGQRAELIEQFYPQFALIKGAPRKLQNKFWDDFFEAYWAKFQWNLPLDRDPDPSFPPPPQETEEIVEQKRLIIKTTQEVSLSGPRRAMTASDLHFFLSASQIAYALPCRSGYAQGEQPVDGHGAEAQRPG